MLPKVHLPTLSIITPSYNQGTFIASTIQSVLGQNYPSLEYIVVDGGSTDETLSVLHRHPGELTWTSHPDSGQVHALNQGLSMASGEIVAFLNSDDVYTPGALWFVGSYFAAHPGCGWLSGRCHLIDRDGGSLRPLIACYKNMWLRLGFPTALYWLNFISQPATFWRRDLMISAGYFDASLTYAFDYDYWLRLTRICRPTFVNTNLARFRIHTQSKSCSANCAQFDEQYRVVNRYTASPLILGLHKVHNRLTTLVYSSLAVSQFNPS